MVLYLQGKYAPAESAFREAVRLKPGYAKTHVLSRRDAERAGAPGGGRGGVPRRRPRQARQPGWRTAGWAACCYRPGAPCRGGVRLSREALRLHPEEGQNHFNLWMVLERQGKHAESEAAYREAIRLKPDFAEAHARLGSVLLRVGRLEEAEAAYAESVRLHPDDTRFRSGRDAVRRRLATRS